MPAPIDLSELPPSRPIRSGRGKGGRGTGFIIDEYARKTMWAGLIVCVLVLGYLLTGLYSGAWDHDTMAHLLHTNPADHQRQIDNIAFVFRTLQISTVVFLVGFLICCLRDESVGYILLGVGLIFYAGVPALTSQIYDLRNFKSSDATETLMHDFQNLAWLFFAPGLIWTLGDLLRRFRSASEAAAVQRANAKYGANVQKQKVVKRKNVFLGRCFEGPYCRTEIRERCPVFLRKRGPCWQYKEGCMCEERIILQAVISKDWKHQAAQADAAYNFGEKRSGLTPAAKRERCRNCVIYNEHQRQKYKAMVAVALVAFPVLLYLNVDLLQAGTAHILAGFEAVMERFSFGESSTGVSFLHGRPNVGVEWVFIGAVCIVLLAQIMKFIEFWCFKIKI